MVSAQESWLPSRCSSVFKFQRVWTDAYFDTHPLTYGHSVSLPVFLPFPLCLTFSLLSNHHCHMHIRKISWAVGQKKNYQRKRFDFNVCHSLSPYVDRLVNYIHTGKKKVVLLRIYWHVRRICVISLWNLAATHR